MNGLEAVEIRLSELEFTRRIDAEYYKKEYLHYEEEIMKSEFKRLEEVSNFLIGPFGSAFKTENYEENSGYRYVRGQDVKPFRLQDSDNKSMPQEDFERLKKYSLKKNDVLVSVVGTLGNACIVQQEDLPGIFSCKSTVLRSKEINPVYLLTYLNAKQGRNLLLRKERGAIQKGLNLDDLKSLIINIPTPAFQLHIENVFYKAQGKLKESKSLYAQAEQLLLDELGLHNWKPTEANTEVKSFKNSFLESGRLDAEYYQPKYDEIENKIKEYKGGYSDLGKILKEITTGEYSSEYSSKAKGLRFYIRNTNILQGEIIEDEAYYVHPSNFSKFAKEGQILTARVGAIGNFGTISKKFEGAIYSDNVLAIELIDNLNPEVYTCYFNSTLNRELLKRITGGSVQPLITQTSIKEILIPLFPKLTQEKALQLIQQSFQLKK